MTWMVIPTLFGAGAGTAPPFLTWSVCSPGASLQAVLSPVSLHICHLRSLGAVLRLSKVPRGSPFHLPAGLSRLPPHSAALLTISTCLGTISLVVSNCPNMAYDRSLLKPHRSLIFDLLILPARCSSKAWRRPNALELPPVSNCNAGLSSVLSTSHIIRPFPACYDSSSVSYGWDPISIT